MANTFDLGRVRGKDYVLTEADRHVIAQKVVPNATAEAVSLIDAYYGYEGDNDILGLQVDYENKKFTRLAGAVGLEAGDDFDQFPMYGGIKRCNISNNGIIKAYYGDASYKDSGSNGQVMVYVPKFYYKVVPFKLDKNTDTNIGYHIRKANYYITDKQKVGFKLHPAFYDENGNELEYFLYSAYEGSLWRSAASTYYNDAYHTSKTLYDNDLICSEAGRKPISGQNIPLTFTRAETYCSNRGNGWHCETIQSLSALQFLMMIEYGTMNLQGALGQGVSYITINDGLGYNISALTGATTNLGNKSGNAASTQFDYINPTTLERVQETRTGARERSFSYRGIENPYANLNKYTQGINIYGNKTMGHGQFYICTDFKYNPLSHSGNYEPTGFTVPNSSANYVTALGYGNEKYDWVLLPSESSENGNSSLPIGDKWYPSSVEQVNGHLIMRHGLTWNYGYACGMFAGASTTSYTTSGGATGCRLIYLPQTNA